MSVYKIRQGNRLPVIGATLYGPNNAPIDLTGADSVHLVMWDRFGSLYLDAPAVIDTPATDGHVHYDWQAGDTDQVGLYYSVWRVTFSGERAMDVPNTEDADEVHIVGSPV